MHLKICKRASIYFRPQWVNGWAFGLLESGSQRHCPGSNPDLTRRRWLGCFQFEIISLFQNIQIKTTIRISPEPGRTNSGSGVKSVECSLITGTGYRVPVFDLIPDNSIGLWVGIRPVGEWVPGVPRFNWSWPTKCWRWCQRLKGCEFTSRTWQHKLVCDSVVSMGFPIYA